MMLADAAASEEFGAHLAAAARAGDVITLSGPLGAGNDPHAHDLCAIHTTRMSVPKGWVVVRHETLRV